MGYKMEVMGIEGLATALVLLALPFIILAVMIRLLPTERIEDRLAPRDAPTPEAHALPLPTSGA
jgi:hypothetical protein